MAETTRNAVRLEDRRPLSPHLQVYRPMLTMMMSIAHRITGGALYVGILLIAWYLVAAASGPQAFQTAYDALGSILGRLVLFGFSWALFHHFVGGVRHAIWDTGAGMEAKQRELLAMATLIGGFVLTILVWIVGYMVR